MSFKEHNNGIKIIFDAHNFHKIFGSKGQKGKLNSPKNSSWLRYPELDLLRVLNIKYASVGAARKKLKLRLN